MNGENSSSILLNYILEYSFDEIFITDAIGTILHISANTETMFNVLSENITNKNIYDLERQGIFSPSVITKVLETGQQTTIEQETAQNRKIIISGYPVFDENQTLIKALSFSRDITEFEHLKKENYQVAIAMQESQQEINRLKEQIHYSSFSRPKNQKINQIRETLSRVADLDVTVLLKGESGVGKNLIAQTIHQNSKRRGQPFIEVNCGALPESLIESELFGYEEGAFTGAKKGGKKGYFEAAQKGTLLLDEIAELPKNLQVKLLSVLNNGTITRVGGNKSIEVTCRIICATNHDLEELVEENKFRQDLYYRINVIDVTIPPLRERKEELIPLIYEIVEEMNYKYHMQKQFSPGIIAWMGEQKWPGNVRELRHFIEKIIVTSAENVIDLDHMMVDNQIPASEPFEPEKDHDVTLKSYMEATEQNIIVSMYQKYPNSIQLAKKLGISQSTANRKIQKYIENASQS